MAQNKPNGGFQRKNRDNYFKKELQQYRGSAPINFMANKNTIQRNRDCKAICKDLATGNIDPNAEAGYFLQPELLDQLCIFTKSKLFYHSFLAEAAEEKRQRMIAMMGPGAIDGNILEIVNMHTKSSTAYNILYTGFLAIRSGADVVGWLNTMISQLSSGKCAGNI